MNTLSLCWHLLSIVGGLPEELIVKILFHYSGLRHPIVNMLLKSTKVKEYETLRKLPFSKSIYRFYLNKEKYSNLFGIDIITFLNNNQRSYFQECRSYFAYQNPGYFIPRKFGRLDYNALNDLDLVETNIHVDWKLNRSKRILESIKCQGTRLSFRHNKKVKCQRGFHSCNELTDIKNPIFISKSKQLCRVKDRFDTIKYAHKLMLFEEKIEADKKMKLPFGTHVNHWLCRSCIDNTD
jgi:hypothetical protein